MTISRRERFTLIPLPFDEACAFVASHHRHHVPTCGHKFSLGAVLDGKVVGVAVCARPVARLLADDFTLEVTRLATDGTKNACSFLYGACRRAAFALGYRKVITYTLQSESGESLRGAGWKVVGEVKGQTWNRTSRPRVDKHPLQDKFRWESIV